MTNSSRISYSDDVFSRDLYQDHHCQTEQRGLNSEINKQYISIPTQFEDKPRWCSKLFALRTLTDGSFAFCRDPSCFEDQLG